MATLLVAMAVAVGLGAGVYYALNKTTLQRQEESGALAHERANELNISAIAQVAALMSYATPTPNQTDPTVQPYLFPDPYINNKVIGATRAAPGGVSTWSFKSPVLTIYQPADSNLHVGDFAAYATTGQRPPLSRPVTVEFLGPVMDTTHPYWIKAYQAQATTGNITTKATFPVPRPAKPTCSISSAQGTSVAPDAVVDLTLTVSGVAQYAKVPTTAAQIAAGTLYNDYSSYTKVIDLTSKATSIAKNFRAGGGWKATIPRPLAAVDNTGSVPFAITAFVQPIDDEDPVPCTLNISVSSPASCKLFTSQASVPPGACTSLAYTTLGPVQPNSFTLAAQDLGGNDASSGITQTSASTYQFCTPPSTYTGAAVSSSLPANLVAAYSNALTGLTFPQIAAIGGAMSKQLNYFKSAFASSVKPLRSLTIGQATLLSNLSQTQLDNLDRFDPSDVKGLETLTQTQVKDIQSLDPDMLVNLKIVDLSSISSLSTLSDADLQKLVDQLNGFDPKSVVTYTTAVAASSNAPVDYLLTGTVQDTKGNPNTCVSHVTAGVNQCPFFGNSYPNYGQNLSLYVNYYNISVGNIPFTFRPGAPNWETATVADSPFDVSPCPPDARCFAMDWGTARTPFVTVQPANSASCQASVSDRINLGCFAYHTNLRMADGKDKEINLVRVGDMVLNPIRNTPMRVKRTTLGPEKSPMVVLQAGGHRVSVTTKHPMLTKTGLRTAVQMQVGDEIKDAQGVWQRIDKIDREQPRLSVINIELDTPSHEPEDHAVLADGLTTGDLYLQEQMAKIPAGS